MAGIARDRRWDRIVVTGSGRIRDDLVHLLELRKENLEIIEVEIDRKCPCLGKPVEDLGFPPGSRLISVLRDGQAEIAVGATVLQEGDQVLVILEPGKETEDASQLITVIGRGHGGTRAMSHTLSQSGVYMGDTLNKSGDLLPPEAMYEACRVMAKYVTHKGGLEWDFSKLHAMPIDGVSHVFCAGLGGSFVYRIQDTPQGIEAVPVAVAAPQSTSFKSKCSDG